MKRWTPVLVATIVSMTVPAFSQDAHRDNS
jgi:hypothetical protein